MLNRRRSTVMASGRFGISGTRINRTLEGRWVKTMVLTSPKRRAKGAASKAENPARMLAPKKIAPSTAGGTSKRR